MEKISKEFKEFMRLFWNVNHRASDEEIIHEMSLPRFGENLEKIKIEIGSIIERRLLSVEEYDD